MKNLLQNLLIFLSLCLCALIAFQWHREAKLRQDIQTLHDEIHNHKENLQNMQQAQKHADEEIKRLDGLKSELTETVKSNRTEIASLVKDLAQSDKEIKDSQERLVKYKEALQQANESITRQNESIRKQNEDMKTLQKVAEERNEMVAKYNQTAKEFNELIEKWNALQATLTTNAPPAKK